MSIVVVQTFTAASGRYGELAETIGAMLNDTAARAGAEFVHAAGDPKAGVVTVYEQWDSAENLNAYTAWRMGQAEVAELVALLQGPPKIEQLSFLF